MCFVRVCACGLHRVACVARRYDASRHQRTRHQFDRCREVKGRKDERETSVSRSRAQACSWARSETNQSAWRLPPRVECKVVFRVDSRRPTHPRLPHLLSLSLRASIPSSGSRNWIMIVKSFPLSLWLSLYLTIPYTLSSLCHSPCLYWCLSPPTRIYVHIYSLYIYITRLPIIYCTSRSAYHARAKHSGIFSFSFRGVCVFSMSSD